MGKALKNIPWADRIGYGAGNLGFGIIVQLMASYLVFYSTAVVSIPGSLVGLAVSIGVIWDAVTDPMMGYISDRTNFKRFGRRHLYLLIGTVGTALFNYLLWIISPSMDNNLKFLWILADLLIIKTFTTIYATPYTALGAELSCDYNERTSIQGVKTIFFTIGLLLAAVMGMLFFFKPTPEYPVGQLNPQAYAEMGITASLVMVVTGFMCFIFTRKYIPKLNIGEKRTGCGIAGVFKGFGEAFTNKQYMYVVVGYLFTNIATAIAGTLALHVFTYTFVIDNKGIAAIIGTQFFMTILSQPIWVLISRKIDKKSSVKLGLSFAVIGSIMLFVLVLFRDNIIGNFLYLIFPAALVGFGTGSVVTIPLSMIADTIDLEELKTGVRREGVYYGCQTFIYKLSQSIAIFLLGVLLDILKFDSSAAAQPATTAITLGCTLTLGSAGAFALAFAAYSRYGLDRDRISEIQVQLSEGGGGTGAAL